MNLYIAYNRRSCVTGKALFDTLKELFRGTDISVRRTMNTPRERVDILLRWGNSLLDTAENVIEINNKQALELTANKLAMINNLSERDGVNVPTVGRTAAEATNLVDSTGRIFIRDQNDHVRYDLANNYRHTDKYALRPVDKVREYRVHIFNGRTIGMYEKIPEREGIKIFKNDNCTFRRVNQADAQTRERIRNIRPMCRSAVESLGLVFGGVDVLVDRNGNIFINEVNSAPALNGPNLERWGESIRDYVNSIRNNRGVEPPVNLEQQREEQERRREAERAERMERVITRLHTVAQEEGYTITDLNVSETIREN